jgi:membrane protein implicated in regulation of membrane protease activity
VISIVQFVLFAACAGVLIWVGWDLIRSDETEDPLRGLREQYSVPMPASPPAQPAPEPGR